LILVDVAERTKIGCPASADHDGTFGTPPEQGRSLRRESFKVDDDAVDGPS
jgi:hypothetical protein